MAARAVYRVLLVNQRQRRGGSFSHPLLMRSPSENRLRVYPENSRMLPIVHVCLFDKKKTQTKTRDRFVLLVVLVGKSLGSHGKYFPTVACFFVFVFDFVLPINAKDPNNRTRRTCTLLLSSFVASCFSATQAEARRRVEEEARAFEFAQIQAKRRDSEGLSMRPHPGNRLEPVPASEKDGYGGKASAYFGGGGKGGQESEKEKSENEKNRVREQERKAEAAAAGPEAEATTSGGYDFPEYEPAEYVIPEYKSVYDI